MDNLTGKQFGNYQIISQCGQGGMATIYKAYQPSMDRFVALKVLPKFHSLDPEFLGRFEQEAKALAQLQHPHILPIYDYGESEGYTYFVMPLMQGGNLAELLVKEKLSIYRIHQIISQIGSALEVAHSLGFIHRDVKPSNILLDQSGNCMLMDFGIAKIIEGSKEFTRTGGILGTPVYMSPEQGCGEKIDHRSDIYSLGIILYEMITGRPPFNAETPVAIIFKHVHDPLPAPSLLIPDLSEDVEKVILKSLAKNPDERYQTVREMVNAFSKAVLTTVHQEPTIIELTPTLQESMPAAQRVRPESLEEECPAEEAATEIQPESEPKVETPIQAPGKFQISKPLLILSGAIVIVIIGVLLTKFSILSPGEKIETNKTGTSADILTESYPATDIPFAAILPTSVTVTDTDQVPKSTPAHIPSTIPAYPLFPTSQAPDTGFDNAFFIGFDPDIAPFDNLLVRRAIASAIDRVGLIGTVAAINPESQILPATSLTPPDILGFELYGQVGYPFDKALAQQLLAEAGYLDGEGFPTIILFHGPGEAALAVAEHVSENLTEVLSINVLTEATQLNYSELPTFYVMGWSADYLDPHNFLYDPICGTANIDFVGSEEYGSMLELINNERDFTKRISLIKEYSDIFCGGTWNPNLNLSEEYKRILDQALDEQDSSISRMLYVDAEIILVETETIIVPLFHRTN